MPIYRTNGKQALTGSNIQYALSVIAELVMF